MNDIKTKILIKKITVNFIIDSYANISRWYRYIHMGFAITAPLITLIDYAATGDVNATFSTSLILSAVVAGMVKIKDHMKFDKIRDIAKHQSLRYERLYKHIEAEEAKHAASPDFLYWITRAFNDISHMDPELPAKDREKLNNFLIAHKIEIQTDIQRLQGAIEAPPATPQESGHTGVLPLSESLPYNTRDDIQINIERLAALNI
jgi:hypothetical protein